MKLENYDKVQSIMQEIAGLNGLLYELDGEVTVSVGKTNSCMSRTISIIDTRNPHSRLAKKLVNKIIADSKAKIKELEAEIEKL